MRYESATRFKNQNGEERHTDALLFADVMDPPQIRKDKRTWPLGYLALFKFILRNIKEPLQYNQK